MNYGKLLTLVFFWLSFFAQGQLLKKDLANNLSIENILVNEDEYLLHVSRYFDDSAKTRVDSFVHSFFPFKKDSLKNPSNLFESSNDSLVAFFSFSTFENNTFKLYYSNFDGDSSINLYVKTFDENYNFIQEKLLLKNSLLFQGTSVGKNGKIIVTQRQFENFTFFFLNSEDSLINIMNYKAPYASAGLSLNCVNDSLCILNFRENIFISNPFTDSTFQRIGSLTTLLTFNRYNGVNSFFMDSVICFLKWTRFHQNLGKGILFKTYNPHLNIWDSIPLSLNPNKTFFSNKRGVNFDDGGFELFYAEYPIENPQAKDTNFVIKYLRFDRNLNKVDSSTIINLSGYFFGPEVFKIGEQTILAFVKHVFTPSMNQKQGIYLVFLDENNQVVKVESNITNSQISKLSIFPNPTNSTLNFKEPLSHYSIFNLQGKVMKISLSLKAEIDVSNLTRGIYIIIGETLFGKAVRQKFVKE